MKPHYPILDGLRGTAAILVFMFHLLEAVFPKMVDHPMHHGYLAVDFFFLLSGFVVGYAYDDRWGKMTIVEFFKIRLIRLHPLVVVSILLGGVMFWFDPYANAEGKVSLTKLMGTMLIGLTLLPMPDIRGWDETHSLNGPGWSLLQEYIANVIYAIFGRKITGVVLWVIVIVSGGVLTYVAIWKGELAVGWSYKTFWMGVARMMFPFFAGLLLFRTGKLLRIKHAYIVCSLLLVAIFFLPVFKYNGLFEAASIIIVFPIIVAAGAGGAVEGRLAKVCAFSGAISYPLYIIHYPFIYTYTYWVYIDKPDRQTIFLVASGLFVFVTLLAYGILKLYDEPVRAWLKRKLLSPGSYHL